MKTLLAFCATLGLLMVTSTASAHTSPEDLAARCVGAVNGIVDRCQNAAADETQECLQKIRRLLAEGRERAARRVAADCIESATERTENCAKRINRICDECVDQLVSLGAPQLARRVNSACEDAISDLRSTLQRQKNAIRGAFGG
ncbi:hypothetical protein Pan241w_43080 [Gimesia alba]|uniref:Four-helix bundle copper-binding protein n=1 Tax=Gimesia alba TaxID=2527973 RepID=A0A517RJY2_9PLAN|nr:hypothetical protein [Gimesia alba]QDT44200.1 hypothetical protein Pan241w_43080 [Gimesia alba]